MRRPLPGSTAIWGLSPGAATTMVIMSEAFGADILRLCVEVGGCLTGEHGVGVEKRDLMGVQFSEIELDQQRRIKSAFDPDWLLNPSKVFPLIDAPAAAALAAE